MIMYKFIKEIILSILMSKIYFSMYRRSLLWILEELHLTHSNTFRLTSFISSSVMFVFSDFLCSWVIYLLTRHLTTLHQWQKKCVNVRVSVQGVKSLGGHFACLCRGFEFYEVKRIFFVIIFQKENGNTFTLFIIFIVKSLQKEQNSTNLLLWPPICRNKSAITPKWFNSLDTNSII